MPNENEILPLQSDFEQIKRTDADGRIFWSAREQPYGAFFQVMSSLQIPKTAYRISAPLIVPYHHCVTPFRSK